MRKEAVHSKKSSGRRIYVEARWPINRSHFPCSGSAVNIYRSILTFIHENGYDLGKLKIIRANPTAVSTERNGDVITLNEKITWVIVFRGKFVAFLLGISFLTLTLVQLKASICGPENTNQ